ncbi:fused MFS/spermidine synthase [Paraburkholderia lycopersici]|uniref:Spermidine synthase n=1 Tax=Paraburkholderia lycopersici TaxID=416944 RepID=A0A1G6QR43_9BURK|nr:fused MFS/spermidine synthase [Paraburkholderia lycopersici]SDC94186.1 spermidine synthase [Paraburkholderia lycopersici]
MHSWENPALPSDLGLLAPLFAELSGQRPGVPAVHDGLRTRILCFGTLGVQTAMRKNDPFALHLPYTRAMMAFQLFQPRPAHILIVGLGGGSLSKYCHLCFPEAIVTTVEIDERVIALRDQFHIPDDSTRFRVVHADAAAHLAARRDTADVILLDGFDAFGLPVNLSSQAFYDDCHACLRDGGVLVANLLERGACAASCFERIGRAFEPRTYCTWARHDGNPIAVAVKNAPAPDWPALHQRARDIVLAGGLDLVTHAKNMERNDVARIAAHGAGLTR